MGFESRAFARKATIGVRLYAVERKEIHSFAQEPTESTRLGAGRQERQVGPLLTPNGHRAEYRTRSVRRASGFVQVDKPEKWHKNVGNDIRNLC